MEVLPALSMNQTKAKLLEHLKLSLETYDLMARETDEVYRWLTADRAHLKSNCVKDKPPYDWSDLRERSKDSAMQQLASSKLAETSYYWKLAKSTPECENWIARWFLYKLFRNRDGRNRAGNEKVGGDSHRRSNESRKDRHGIHGGSPKSSRSALPVEDRNHQSDQLQKSVNYGNTADYAGDDTMSSGTWTHQTYSSYQPPIYAIQQTLQAVNTISYVSDITDNNTATSSNYARAYWDPVRNV